MLLLRCVRDSLAVPVLGQVLDQLDISSLTLPMRKCCKVWVQECSPSFIGLWFLFLCTN